MYFAISLLRDALPTTVSKAHVSNDKGIATPSEVSRDLFELRRLGWMCPILRIGVEGCKFLIASSGGRGLGR